MGKKAIFMCLALLIFASAGQAQVLKKLKKAAQKTVETVEKTEKNIQKVEETKNAIQNEVEETKNSIQSDVDETVGTNNKKATSTSTSSDNNTSSESTQTSSVNSVSQAVKHDGKAIYVSKANGNNGNDGTKNSPYKNLQKALDNAPAGATIMVAEGNYYGLLNSGNINITKPVTIMGGYNSDFSERNILKYRTMIQPTPESNGSHTIKGTISLTSIVAPNDKVVIDGLIIDRGNTISYNKAGKGRPEGVESPQMNPIGTKGLGGADLKYAETFTKESSEIYFNGDKGIVNNVNVIIRNCAFINAPNYAILGLLKTGSLTVENCIFVNIRMATIDVRGADPKVMTPVTLRNNTILFSWSRLLDLASMGYGFRMQPGTCNTLENNIIGCSVFSGIDRTHIDSDKNRETLRKDVVNNNIFFLNRQTDLTLPGGGMLMRVKCEDFSDVEQISAKGNKSLADPKIFNGKIDKAYLEGFINLSYKEESNVDYNSSANTFRQAMGMNMTGTMTSEGSMFANRYPWQEALKLFGAMQGYGAQMPK
ncbi:MAG: DUF1565 domain-containing protein [Bacteroidota bacterium]|nr:DUF1565 domain-containing protein [Bacteroidota bacterium]